MERREDQMFFKFLIHKMLNRTNLRINQQMAIWLSTILPTDDKKYL